VPTFRHVVIACISLVACLASPPSVGAANERGAPPSLTPDQLADGRTLSVEEAYAACGPAAAVALARALGLDPGLDEAVEHARKVGWTAALGMSGPRSQVHLLAYLGVAARLDDAEAVDWAAVVRHVRGGNPVILVAPGHYFVAEGFAEETGALDLGTSAAVLTSAGGRRWFAPSAIGSLGMGQPQRAIFLGRPLPADGAQAARDAWWVAGGDGRAWTSDAF